ncbi:hypothetical protein NUW58_g722 [Xylaria curta]|uniref:Uncharacterized protein n=1 Tax=Xylaria curta TaxID=42375 RepID=A0ACC1PRJ1_9PEZI|nr:hypothetical protein NUW58_g722 [Xylaria curta]
MGILPPDVGQILHAQMMCFAPEYMGQADCVDPGPPPSEDSIIMVFPKRYTSPLGSNSIDQTWNETNALVILTVFGRDSREIGGIVEFRSAKRLVVGVEPGIESAADAEQGNSDALKGGGNNFGIVTSFTLTTVPLDQVWGGVLVAPKDTIPKICRLTSEFVTKIPENLDNNLIVVIGYLPDLKDIAASVAVVNTRGVTDAAVFDQWKELPKIADTTKTTSVYDLSFEVTLPENYYTSWFTLTFKNEERIMAKASELHDRLVSSLLSFVPEGDFMSQCIFQPLPTIIAQHSVREGGNIMGLEDNESDGILFQMITMMKTPEQHAFAYAQLKACVESLRDFAGSVEGGLFRWLYMNYADKSQDVLGSYGPENVKKMREVADKYDPTGVFQKLCPGGWKLAKIDA